jgi:ribosomal-protein-alanine N-acetyltransferase
MRRNTSFAEFPSLETNRLFLREIIPADAPIVYEILSDPVVTRYYDVETFTKKEQALRHIRWYTNRFKYREGIRWAIVHRQSNILIGTCGFHNWHKSSRRVEMGYELAAQQWGRGFATEAATRILKFGFDHLNFNRIEAWAMLDNRASMHVLKKLGFCQEGVLREYGYWHGRFHDVMMFSILKREWDARAT